MGTEFKLCHAESRTWIDLGKSDLRAASDPENLVYQMPGERIAAFLMKVYCGAISICPDNNESEPPGFDFDPDPSDPCRWVMVDAFHLPAPDYEDQSFTERRFDENGELRTG